MKRVCSDLDKKHTKPRSVLNTINILSQMVFALYIFAYTRKMSLQEQKGAKKPRRGPLRASISESPEGQEGRWLGCLKPVLTGL